MKIEISEGIVDDFENQDGVIAYNSELEVADVYISNSFYYTAYVKDGVVLCIEPMIMRGANGWHTIDVKTIESCVAIYEKIKR